MYPSHDMNPVAIEHIRRERLAAHVECVERSTGARVYMGGAAIAIILMLAIVI